jgi:putative restriction endonuclease
MRFEIGTTYSREGIQDLLGVPAKRRGGIWNTGYARYDGVAYVFCNVGIAGHTGHDYPNRWDGEELIWYGKTGSTVDQPLMRAMISGRVPVNVFWRGQLERPFSYAGIGRCVGVQDVSPVEVRWRFRT